MKPQEAVEEFRRRRPLYEEFTAKVHALLEELRRTDGLHVTVESRTKSVQSFEDKIHRSRRDYTNPLDEVIDLCGIRIICRRLMDLEAVEKLLAREFQILPEHSSDRRKELQPDQFGYLSVHYGVKLSPERLVLSEWQRFKSLKAEIQVRTILQHAWATISHSLDYKTTADIPSDLRRRLFRLSALFELADEELEAVAILIENRIAEYKELIVDRKYDIEVNVDSLRTYVETSDEMQYWRSVLTDRIGTNPDSSWSDLSRDVRIAHHCNLHTIDEVDRALNSCRGWGEAFLSDYVTDSGRQLASRVSVVQNGALTLLLIAKHYERFPPDLLQQEFGFGNARILDVARRHRRMQ